MILDHLTQLTGLTDAELGIIIRTASRRYKTYTIAKRNGIGRRPISHPSPEVKFLQSWISENVFELLPIHDAVMSYRKNLSIRDNASAHREQNYLLKLDFREFFTSITANDIKNLLTRNAPKVRHICALPDDLNLITSLVCKNGALTIGAPSSPAISNVILFDFDQSVARKCAEMQVVYTRYADDLAFSTNEPNLLSEILGFVKLELARLDSPRISLNDEKTSFTSRKRRRQLTGLILTSDNKVSIGRKKKREIRSLIFKYMNNDLSAEQVAYLKGYLAFIQAVEPNFITSIKSKYGPDILDRLKTEPTVSLK